MTDLQQLVLQADHDGLLLAVDGLCARRDWDGLVTLARRCRDAVELGRQLWGVAMHIDYRLALEAPARYAGAVLAPGAGRFTLGPLTEVAAGQHPWSALAPHIADPASRGAVAQERVLRGERLHGVLPEEPAGEGLPLCLQDWEPRYPLPLYRDRSAKFPGPEVQARPLPSPDTLSPGAPLPPDDAVEALRRVVEPWVAESQGSARAVVVEGDVPAAVGALLARASLLPITAADALALLQWAGASGGAHGRRRGGASGRFATWWAAAMLAGLSWPPDPAELGAAVQELSWFRWSPPGGETGWVLRLAVGDPVDGLAWALDASDSEDDDRAAPADSRHGAP